MTQFIADPTKSVNLSPEASWAEDVVFVYQNLTHLVSEADAGSSGRYALHRWASEEKNMDKFLKDMVPKAMDTLAKNQRSGDDEDARFEAKSVSELKELIRRTVQESKE